MNWINNQWNCSDTCFFPNKNIVSVSEAFDGTIEESIWRRLFWQDVGKGFKREPTIS